MTTKPSLVLSQLLLLLYALVLLSACQKSTPPQTRPVQATQVELKNLSSRYTYAGVVQAYHYTTLSFQVGGKLIHRYVEMGDIVKPGQLLAEIDTNDLNLETNNMRAELLAAQEKLDLSKSNLDRYTPLVKQGYVSKIFYQQAQTNYTTDLATVEKLKSSLALTQRKQDYSKLFADYSGIITNVQASPGQVVSAGQPIMQMARDDEKNIVINVPEQRIQQWQNIKTVDVNLWAYPTKKYIAEIREISGEADPVTRTYTIKLRVTNADALMRLGMTAKVQVTEVQTNPAILVPLTAIYYESRTPSVWVIDTKTMRVHSVKVTVGAYADNQIIVRTGLKSGDWVATAGTYSLHEGQVVTFVKELPL